MEGTNSETGPDGKKLLFGNVPDFAEIFEGKLLFGNVKVAQDWDRLSGLQIGAVVNLIRFLCFTIIVLFV